MIDDNTEEWHEVSENIHRFDVKYLTDTATNQLIHLSLKDWHSNMRLASHLGFLGFNQY